MHFLHTPICGADLLGAFLTSQLGIAVVCFKHLGPRPHIYLALPNHFSKAACSVFSDSSSPSSDLRLAELS